MQSWFTVELVLKIHRSPNSVNLWSIEPGIELILSPNLFKLSKIDDLLIKSSDLEPRYFNCFEISYLATPFPPIEIIKWVDNLIRFNNSFLDLKIGFLFWKVLNPTYFQKY